MQQQGAEPMMNAAVQTSSLMTWLPILALVMATAIMMKWQRTHRRLDTSRIAQLDASLVAIRKQVVMVSTTALPGKKTLKTIGFLESTSDIEVSSDGDYRIAEKDALLALGEQALSLGANTIIGLRKSHSHYDQAGSKWRVVRVTYSGTAVITT
jgi:hypothetical protein